jgi:hypothetical protein
MNFSIQLRIKKNAGRITEEPLAEERNLVRSQPQTCGSIRQ